MTATVDGALVDDFISSHKSKLAKEKDRMSSTHERQNVGILPSDDGREAEIEKKKREMRDEYLTYIKERENRGGRGYGRRGSDKTSSVAEVRREMASTRTEEIQPTTHRQQTLKKDRPQKSVGVASWDHQEKELHNWVNKRGNRGNAEHDERSTSLPTTTRTRVTREPTHHNVHYDDPFQYNAEPPYYGQPYQYHHYHDPYYPRPPHHYEVPPGRGYPPPHPGRGYPPSHGRGYPPPSHGRGYPPPEHNGYLPPEHAYYPERDYSPPGHGYLPPRTPSPKPDDMASYRDILKQQIEEKRKREETERDDKERFIRKIESEAAVYDPWGKPGAGAPLLDNTGNVITERGQMSKSFDQSSPRLSDEERKRMQQLKHREELEEQIKQRKIQDEELKMQNQLEEEEEEKRLRMERNELLKRGQKEMEHESNDKSKRDSITAESPVAHTPLLTKQELAEKSLKQALEKDKRKKQEEEERLDRLANKMAAHTEPEWKRSSSPPIPTLASRSKVMTDDRNVTSNVPTSVTNVPTNVPTFVPSNVSTNVPTNVSTNVTNVPTIVSTNVPTYVPTYIPTSVPTNVPTFAPQYTTVPAVLGRDSVSPEVQILPHPSQYPQHYDNVTSHNKVLQNLSNLKIRLKGCNLPSERPIATTIATKPTIATRPVLPRPRDRPAAARNIVDDFNAIKYSRPSESRLQYWSDHPKMPRTDTSLEMQQTALLQHQQDRLHRHQRVGNTVARDSSTATRGRRRWEELQPRPPSNQSLATINTLDIEGLAARNEDRARRLDAILNAQHNNQYSDPQQVLGNFMQPQCNRDNSETSLECDTMFHPIPHP